MAAAEPEEKKQHDFMFKIVVIGDHGVGKTQLLSRYAKNEFDMHSKTTLGVEFTPHTETIDGKVVGAQLWDTAGEEKYKSLTSIYYKGALGALLVYDITQRKTYERLCTQWLTELKNFSDPNIVAVLIGNKCDLRLQRQVQTDEASGFAEKLGIAFMETSAKDATNVQTAFRRVLEEIYKIVSRSAIKEVKQDERAAVSRGRRLEDKEEDVGSSGKDGRVKLNSRQLSAEGRRKRCC